MSKNRFKKTRIKELNISKSKDIYDILLEGVKATGELWGIDPEIPTTNVSALNEGKNDESTINKMVEEAKSAAKNNGKIEKYGIEFIIRSNDKLNQLYNLTPSLAYLRAIEILNDFVWENPSCATTIINMIEGSKDDGNMRASRYTIASNTYLRNLYLESPDRAYAALIGMMAEEVEGDPQRAARYVSQYNWSIYKLDPDGVPIIEQGLPSKKKQNKTGNNKVI